MGDCPSGERGCRPSRWATPRREARPTAPAHGVGPRCPPAARAAAVISRAGKGSGVRRLGGTMVTAAMSGEGKRQGAGFP